MPRTSFSHSTTRRPMLIGLGAILLLTACNGGDDGFTPDDTLPDAPDMLVTALDWEPNSSTAGGVPVTLSVSISNRGTSGARAFKVRIEIWRNPCTPGESFFQSAVIDLNNGLQPNDTQNVDLQFSFPTAGSYGVKAFVDFDEEVDEKTKGSFDGESNNTYDCNDYIDRRGDRFPRGNDIITVVPAAGPDAPG